MVSLTEKIALARRKQRAATDVSAGPSQTPTHSGPVRAPLSSMQKRLWFLDKLDCRASASYHIETTMRLEGPLDTALLQRALNQLSDRHVMLRTTFVEAGGEVFQKIAAPDQMFSLQVLEASQSQLKNALQFEVTAPIDLESGPLVRGVLHALGPDEHVLQLIQHHMVSDGWSVRILLRDLRSFYDALATGRPPKLPVLSCDYTTFVGRQDTSSAVADLAYWTARLDGAAPVLELPKDRPRPNVQSFRGAVQRARLSVKETAAIRDLAKAHKTTLFMVLLTLWGVTLQRLSGQSDLVIGIPSANRPDTRMTQLVGFFANSLPIRIDVGAKQSVSTLLRSVHDTVVSAFDHQSVALEDVVTHVNPERIRGANPIFQTMFTLDDGPDPIQGTMGAIALSELQTDRTTAEFDLSADLVVRDDQLEVQLNYALDLFDAETVARYLDHFVEVMRSAVAAPNTPVCALNMLTTAERDSVVRGFNLTDADFGDALPAHLKIARIATEKPEAVAIFDGSVSLSYAELEAQSNHVAQHLRVAGLSQGERVGLHLDRGSELIISMIGVMKAGGVYLPLDPDYPAERLQYFIDDCRPTSIISQSPERLSAKCRVLTFSDMMAEPKHVKIEPFLPVQDDPVYLIYTSGSTGKPKGVLISHGNLKNLYTGQIERFGLGPEDRVLQFASQNFDMSVEDIFCTLCSGAALVMRPADILAPDHRFLALLREYQVSMVNLPTVFWERWANDIHGGLSEAAYIPRVVAVGGEAAHSQSVRKWFSDPACGDSVWLNAYGPTEATVSATMMQINSDRDLIFETAPIGAPITNYSIYILDETLSPVPIGVVGEMFIGGAGVALGYFERPEATAESFLQDPFSGKLGARMYRTGDLARWRADGTIAYEGRNDSQVKIRGVRIELTEVETALTRCDGVLTAVAVPRQVNGEKALVGYVKLEPSATIFASNLRRALACTLPRVMVPSVIVPVADFVMTPSGKIDRKALPEPDTNIMADEVSAPPEGPGEIQIASIWCDILNVQQVDRHADFFDIGGHSLLGVKMMHRLGRAIGRDLPVNLLFKSPTIAGLSQSLSDEQQSTGIVSFSEDGPGDPLFLIHAGDGDIAYGRAIAATLRGHRSCHGLPALGLNGGDTPLESVEAMAARYVAEIRNVQPSGPYYIAGWSAGGTIALEIAQHLEMLGETVAYLGLIDTRRTYDLPLTLKETPHDAGEAELADLCRFWRLDGISFDPIAVGIARPLTSEALLEHMTSIDANDGIECPDDLIRHMRTRRAIAQALCNYTPPRLTVQPVLYAAAVTERIATDLGWATDTLLRLFDATHFTIVQPPVLERLSRAIGSDISATQSQTIMSEGCSYA